MGANQDEPKLNVLHENPDWCATLAAAFDQVGLRHEQWLLGQVSRRCCV